MLTRKELEALDTCRFATRMPSRASAIRELLKRGLAAEGFAAADGQTKSAEFGVQGTSLREGGSSSGGSRHAGFHFRVHRAEAPLDLVKPCAARDAVRGSDQVLNGVSSARIWPSRGPNDLGLPVGLDFAVAHEGRAQTGNAYRSNSLASKSEF